MPQHRIKLASLLSWRGQVNDLLRQITVQKSGESRASNVLMFATGCYANIAQQKKPEYSEVFGERAKPERNSFEISYAYHIVLTTFQNLQSPASHNLQCVYGNRLPTQTPPQGWLASVSRAFWNPPNSLSSASFAGLLPAQ